MIPNRSRRNPWGKLAPCQKDLFIHEKQFSFVLNCQNLCSNKHANKYGTVLNHLKLSTRQGGWNWKALQTSQNNEVNETTKILEADVVDVLKDWIMLSMGLELELLKNQWLEAILRDHDPSRQSLSFLAFGTGVCCQHEVLNRKIAK